MDGSRNNGGGYSNGLGQDRAALMAHGNLVAATLAPPPVMSLGNSLARLHDEQQSYIETVYSLIGRLESAGLIGPSGPEVANGKSLADPSHLLPDRVDAMSASIQGAHKNLDHIISRLLL